MVDNVLLQSCVETSCAHIGVSRSFFKWPPRTRLHETFSSSCTPEGAALQNKRAKERLPI